MRWSRGARAEMDKNKQRKIDYLINETPTSVVEVSSFATPRAKKKNFPR